MKLNFWQRLFGKSKGPREKRYVLNLNGDLRLADLVEYLRRDTPVITSRTYNKLPAALKALFVKV